MDYSYQHHIDVMKELVERLDLNEATFFGQDWGGLVGLRVVAEMPDRFARVVVSNTGMPSRGGFGAFLFKNFIKLRVWWEGPVTLEELQAGALQGDGGPNAFFKMDSSFLLFRRYGCLLPSYPV